MQIPRSAFNFVLLLIALGLVRYLTWLYWGLKVENFELWAVLGLGTVSSVVWQLLGVSTREWFVNLAHRFFSSARATRFLGGTCIAMLIAGSVVTVVIIGYSSDRATTLTVDGRAVTLDASEREVRLYRAVFSKVSLECGTFGERMRTRPLQPSRVTVPAMALLSGSAEFQRIEEELTKSFFQLYERKYLTQAGNLIAVALENKAPRESVQRLSSIKHILEFSVGGQGNPDARKTLLDDFARTFPNDPWLPFVRAAVAFSNRDYTAVAALLPVGARSARWPGQPAASFFRGVALLRATRDIKDSVKRTQAQREAAEVLHDAELLLAPMPTSELRDLAYPSAIVYQAITAYYQRDFPTAKRHFMRAAASSSGLLCARAWNGVGFINLSSGDIAGAEIALLEALRADPRFAYARSNYGYVLLAKDQLDEAESYFRQNAEDEELRSVSRRDVTLARLALGHVLELRGTGMAAAANYYAKILREEKYQDFAAVTPLSLRLAHLYFEIADKGYLNPDAYGLEVFALVFLLRAKALCLEPALLGDARARDLSDRIDAVLPAVRNAVPQPWLDGTDHGKFFDILKTAGK